MALHQFYETVGRSRIKADGRFIEQPHRALHKNQAGKVQTAQLAGGQKAAEGRAAAVEQAVKTALGVTARVSLLPAGSLPVTEGKTRRVVRSGA